MGFFLCCNYANQLRRRRKKIYSRRQRFFDRLSRKSKKRRERDSAARKKSTEGRYMKMYTVQQGEEKNLLELTEQHQSRSRYLYVIRECNYSTYASYARIIVTFREITETFSNRSSTFKHSVHIYISNTRTTIK